MKETLKYYKNPNEDKVNTDLIYRKNVDEETIAYIVNACKCLEIVDNIKFLGYKINSDETTIDPESYITRRSSKKADKEQKYIFINNNRNFELILMFELNAYEKKYQRVRRMIINKKLLLPMVDDDGYYLIKGKRYYLIYQLLESSTYNKGNGLSVKSFLPIDIQREIIEITDIEENEYEIPIYTITMFNKERDILLFYFAEMGIRRALSFLMVDEFISVYEGDLDTLYKDGELDTNFYRYFKFNDSIYVEVDKKAFDEYKYVRTIVGMIKQVINRKTLYTHLYNRDYYLRHIGEGQAQTQIDLIEKGELTLQRFKRMLDINTILILKLEYCNKKDIFCLIRCIMQNFDSFRSKDNLDFKYKRLRSQEIIGAMFTTILSSKFNKITSQKSLTLDTLQKIFSFQGNCLITQLVNSGLMVYDDKMNDLDALTKLKFTMKGQNSLGNKNGKKITSKYRSLDPSKLGYQDIIAIGNSDPGTSGIITLINDIDGLQFSSDHEPEEFLPEFKTYIIDRIKDRDEVGYILIDPTDPDDYYGSRKVLDDIVSGYEFNVTTKTNTEEDDHIQVKFIK